MAGGSRLCKVSLRSVEGAHVPVTPTMPVNSPNTPYRVHTRDPTKGQDNYTEENELCSSIINHVAEKFNSVFKVEEFRNEVNSRIAAIEKKLETNGLKEVEIEKCRRDIKEIKRELFASEKKVIDYNRISSLSDEKKISLKRNIPTYPKYTLSQETIDYLKQPTFDIWYWEPNEMLSLLEHMYHEIGLVDEFNINPITLKRWLLCVQENYRNNPFHNFRHCFCVAQMMYGMIHLCKLNKFMPVEDLGILLTAAVCHDLDHPGYNNTYQINARTVLAIRYNDISPLENHHCAVAFQILSNPECNIFSNCDQDKFKRIRAGMTMLILATDMARHTEIMDKFSSVLPVFDFKNKEHVDTLKMVLIKCCDISNEVRPMEVSEPWVDCLLEEYFNQADREKLEGLPVAPFMDREKVTKPSAQIGFIKFVLLPMFENVAKLFPKIESNMVVQLQGALERYKEMKIHEDAMKSNQTIPKS